MNLNWLWIFKSTYRQQPFFSFLMTIGAVDVFLGVLHQHGFLFLLGLNTIGVAITCRWWLVQCNQTLQTEPIPKYYLPPALTTGHLPLLSTSNHSPPLH
jgi:hypothetical protein